MSNQKFSFSEIYFQFHTNRLRSYIHLYMISILEALRHFVLHQQRDAEVQVTFWLRTILPQLKLPP